MQLESGNMKKNTVYSSVHSRWECINGIIAWRCMYVMQCGDDAKTKKMLVLNVLNMILQDYVRNYSCRL